MGCKIVKQTSFYGYIEKPASMYFSVQSAICHIDQVLVSQLGSVCIPDSVRVRYSLSE